LLLRTIARKREVIIIFGKMKLRSASWAASKQLASNWANLYPILKSYNKY